nr:MFS transporter [uncultured Holophaga sp.]
MNPWRGLEGLPRGAWMLALSTLVNRCGTMVLFFLTLYLIQELHWSPREASAALALSGGASLAAGLFTGQLADRMGHHRTLALSLLGSGLLLAVMPLVHNRPLLLGSIALWSAFSQAFWPSSMALLTGMANSAQRKQAFVLHRLAGNLGIAVGPALGGLLAHWSFRSLFWVDAFTTLAGLGVLLMGVPPLQEGPPGGTRSSTAWKDRRLLLLLAGLLPATLVFTQIHGSLPLWISRDLGYGTAVYGLIFTLNTLLIVLLEVALNQAVASWPHRRQMALGALLLALGFGLTGFGRPLGLLMVWVVLWSLGEMVLLPAASDAVAALAPGDRRGEYMGLYSLTWTLAMTLGPSLGLLGYGHLGSLFWPLCGVVALGGAALLGRLQLV